MTLFEVILALATIAVVLTPIFITQSSMLRRVSKEANAITRLFRAQQFLLESDIDRQLGRSIPSQKEITKPAMNISYQGQPPAKESALARYPNIMIATVSWSWQQGTVQEKDTLLSLVYQPPQQEQEA